MSIVKGLPIAFCVLYAFLSISCSSREQVEKDSSLPKSESSSSSAQKAKKTSEKVNSIYPVITHLKTRNEEITVFSGPSGLHFTVKKKSGEIILKEVSRQEFQAKLPEVYKQIEGSLAADVIIE